MSSGTSPSPRLHLLSYAAELVLIGVGAFLFFFLVLVLQGLDRG